MAFASGRTHLDADSPRLKRPDILRDCAAHASCQRLPLLYGDTFGTTSTKWEE